ncbi:MAG: hypothetical protein ACD_3C00115G0004 [uncultured bacterium (gcode 4)]|uniref:HD domain-containing protein n=1 Tax=uncultured bacterium (gcode 4) TaxID=1234023 RepID=K2GCK5_9BACT|nr:MAG: hypothetical protein ACD_3C00115G0004 [uncultured bacterium (gcode 4)]
MEIVERIRKYVEDECRKETNIYGMNAFNHHFVLVAKYAWFLADRTWADKEIVLISAWLHDIWSILWDYENHHLTSAQVAENILSEMRYPRDRIERIKHCIIAHRWSKSIPRETLEAECIADADAMSHLNNIDSLFFLALTVRKKSPEDARVFVKEKMMQGYNKLTQWAKDLMKNKYDACMLTLDDSLF